jgi:hypothetical protein
MPPAQRGTCVAPREDGLEVSQRPYDPQLPLVGMDAQPVQVMQEVRQPLPAAAGNPERSDSEDARNGPATICLGTEPLGRWRAVSVREPKTALDGATEVPQLLETHAPEADRSRLVGENRKTPGLGSL